MVIRSAFIFVRRLGVLKMANISENDLNKYSKAIERGDISFLENLSHEDMAELYFRLGEADLNKLAEYLTPSQILAAEAAVPEAGRENFAKICDAKLKHFAKQGQAVLDSNGEENLGLATIVEQAAEIERLVSRSETDAQTAEAARKVVDAALQQYDQENGLPGGDGVRLAANMKAVESYWDFDPFAESRVAEIEIPELPLDEAVELMKKDELSLTELAAVDQAFEKVAASKGTDAAAFYEAIKEQKAKLAAMSESALSRALKAKPEVGIGKEGPAVEYLLSRNSVFRAEHGEALEGKLAQARKGLEKPLEDAEFEDIRNTMKAMDIQGKATAFGREKLSGLQQKEAKETMLEAAKLKAMKKLANKDDGVSEEDWKSALKESLNEVLLETYTADQISKGNINQDKIAKGFSKLAEAGSRGKSIKVNADSVAGMEAAVYLTNSTYAARLGQLYGANNEGVGKFASKVKDIDAKWSRRYGENYTLAKNGLKQLGMSTIGFAKFYALGEVAKMCGPIGMAGLGVYRMSKSIQGMSKTYKAMKEQNKDLTFGKFMRSKEGMLGAAGVALSAVSAVIPGMSGAENLGHAAQILRYGQSLAGMGLALGPKVGAVLASPKGKRKAAAVALGVAAAGFMTSCLMRGGGAETEETTDLKNLSEQSISNMVNLDNNGNGIPDKFEPHQEQEFRVVPEQEAKISSTFDENDISAVYGHNPNQAAFERGEFDAENQAAQEARVAAKAPAAVQPSSEQDTAVESTANVDEKKAGGEQIAPMNFNENEDGVRSIVMDGVTMDYSVGADGMLDVSGMPALDNSNDADLAAKMLASLQPDENGIYSVPGEYGMVHSGGQRLLGDAVEQYSLPNLKLQEAAYTDLTERQNMGIELSEGERKFMAGHEADLKKWGLSHDDFGYMGDYAPHENTPEQINLVEEEAARPTAENTEGKNDTQEVAETMVETQQIGGVQIMSETVDGVHKINAVITEPNMELRQAMIEEAKTQDAKEGITGNQSSVHSDQAISNANDLQTRAAVCVYLQQQNPDGNFSEEEAALIKATKAELAKYGFALDNESANQSQQNETAQQTTETGSKADELRAKTHQNQVGREANNQQLSGAERQAYVNEHLGGNEAKANAYQDDIYYKRGRGSGRS